jgi:hypothetical protein
MAEAPRESNVQIIVALIGVTGVILTSLFANWDKLFPPSHAPTADTSATETEQNVANANTEFPSLAGVWHDDDGFIYRFKQNGAEFSYQELKGNEVLSKGRGDVTEERSLAYDYTSSGGDGHCTGLLQDNNRIVGECYDSATGEGGKWSFEIKR